MTTTAAPSLSGGGGGTSGGDSFDLSIFVTTNATRSSSAALGGLCRWTASDDLCYYTLLPIFTMFVLAFLVLVYSFLMTSPTAALNATIKPSESPLLPEAYRHLDEATLAKVLAGVNDVPLKKFLPRIDLDEYVEPAALAGAASVKDMLRADRLVLRDIGFGPTEQKLFSRAIQRRIQLRQVMGDLLKGPKSLTQSSASTLRARTFSQKRRTAALAAMRGTSDTQKNDD